MYGHRIVVSKSLQKETMQKIHAGHQRIESKNCVVARSESTNCSNSTPMCRVCLELLLLTKNLWWLLSCHGRLLELIYLKSMELVIYWQWSTFLSIQRWLSWQRASTHPRQRQCLDSITSECQSIQGRDTSPADLPRSYVVATPSGQVHRNRSQLNVIPECPETENQETQSESSPNVIMTRSCTGTDQAARGTGLRGRCGMTYSVTVMTFFEIVIDIPVVIVLNSCSCCYLDHWPNDLYAAAISLVDCPVVDHRCHAVTVHWVCS